MDIDFTKMQGAGNDFVVIDARRRAVALTRAQIAQIADRRLGVGCDQLILLQSEPGPRQGIDAFVRFFNQDGSEAQACGNGTRCAAALIAAATGQTSVSLRSIAGDLPAEMLGADQVRVDLGAPRLDWADLPLAHETDTLHLGIERDPAACSMGNPHATVIVADLDAIDTADIGPRLERHPLFPERANIGFAQIRTPGRMRLVVWERGAGLTLACGSGACAAVVNAHRRGLVGRDCSVEMPGGVLQVTWRDDGHVLLSGPATLVFAGRIGLGPVAAS